MAARPAGAEQPRLSLVAIPVKLYSATKATAKGLFGQIQEPPRKPVGDQKVVPGVGPAESGETPRASSTRRATIDRSSGLGRYAKADIGGCGTKVGDGSALDSD